MQENSLLIGLQIGQEHTSQVFRNAQAPRLAGGSGWGGMPGGQHLPKHGTRGVDPFVVLPKINPISV
ncbi:protein of unknown function [Rhodovastum atsumiense]|nr:protein of unknown function [Rhodovastum atsumiense]